ncbi:hypothetical protein FKZ61_022575 [Litorilinea aerophila]|uniref:Sortilin N-terminal domain-containing protein n=1 Tax=Litorilinea aerophila TaxID=1204385 RepID=A0A540V8Y9_9CHLR|nr:hypothetical protein [Litorilinea aerophila]MCC9078884.1 hypothetical protein [Litorilinea aerophila]
MTAKVEPTGSLLRLVTRFVAAAALLLVTGACQGSVPMPGMSPVAPSPSPANPAEDLTPSTYPRLLRRVELVSPGASLQDLRYDGEQGRIYVTDTAGYLHVLDAESGQPLARLPYSGELTLDETHRRLYVAPGDGILPPGETPAVMVMDTETLQLVGTLPNSRYVSLDVDGHRLFTGQRLYPGQPTPDNVRVYDGASLQPLGEIPQPGIPVYNPLRNELFILADTVYTADPDRLQVTGGLLPELQTQPFPGCVGCLAVRDGHLFPEANLLVVEVEPISTGGGPGLYPPPRYFDARTLQPLDPEGEALPDLLPTCGSQPLLAPAVQGRVYRQDLYIRYVVYRNLRVLDADGHLLDWRDGLALTFIHPATHQAITAQGYVIDLATLTPVSRVPAFCLLAYDLAADLLFGATQADPERSAGEGEALLVLSARGGPVQSGPAPLPEPLPEQPVTAIQPSPDYARDTTVFAVVGGGQLYRSRDSGHSWTRLQGGLPTGDGLQLKLAFSPAYGQDQTLFAAGFVGEQQGEGVWRSTDGGDHWTPLWHGLRFLRVYDLALSSQFSQDQRLLAYARYTRLIPWERGAGLFRSEDGGLHWSLVMTATEESGLPPPEAMIPARPPTPPDVRLADQGRRLEYSQDGGQSWQTASLTPPPGTYFLALATAPDYPRDPTVYVLGDYNLWQSPDGGVTWRPWPDPRLAANRDYHNGFTDLAVSPRLADGSYHLFVGSYAGEFWTLEVHP